MKATISWMYIVPHEFQRPHVEIIEGEEEIVNYITRLHAYVYDIYVLVEFEGILYDVSEPSGIHAQELITAMIDSKYDEKYAIVYKVPDYDDEIKFHEYLSPYHLWFKISNLEHEFDYYPSTKEDIFFVEYDGYIWDCTNIDRLRQVKQRLIKELKV